MNEAASSAKALDGASFYMLYRSKKRIITVSNTWVEEYTGQSEDGSKIG